MKVTMDSDHIGRRTTNENRCDAYRDKGILHCDEPRDATATQRELNRNLHQRSNVPDAAMHPGTRPVAHF